MINLKYFVMGTTVTTRSSDANVVIEEKRLKNRRTVTVTAFQDIELIDAEMFLKKYFNPDDLIMANGYQSWTETKEFMAGEYLNDLSKRPKKVVEKYKFRAYGSQAFWDMPKGTHLGFDFSYIKGEKPVFIGNMNFKNAYLLIWFEEEKNMIRLQSDVEGKKLLCGESYTLFDFMILPDGTEYFEQFNPRTKEKLFGYTSWYNHYQDINEELILDALEKSDVRFNLFQIDDGYETKVGDWMDVDTSKFPNGLKNIVGKIHDRGLKAGIWLAPFVAETESSIAKEHPEWFAKDISGKYIYAGSNWSGFMPFDLNNEEAVQYVRESLRFHKELGFDFFKLDFSML